jgi:hypothetical protein
MEPRPGNLHTVKRGIITYFLGHVESTWNNAKDSFNPSLTLARRRMHSFGSLNTVCADKSHIDTDYPNAAYMCAMNTIISTVS